ncbi:alanine--tRNA ligase [Thiorhodospira sibirica]|uniref:alanine--tRNA ligase n=1 Tax=Thiorhodospira sibirica TaxID=154347 RepID=UPI00022C1712|nr:alanine--tRNA ligase [Thiorhodospira sibirica]
MKSADIRSSFLDYFRSHGHEVVPSSALVPENDPTLLFTNAGMVPFKDVFLGRESLGYVRAASAQRCVRAGGKHNDLENVGYTARHHTFFEMLGNFSFGDYFKRDAIELAWRYLTQVLKIPAQRLWVTVFEEDDEAAAIWLNEIGVDPARFARIGAADNFWAMGDTGPCGPCSEIFYDHGPEIPGGPPGSPDADGDRYVEIWNLVFMQYNRDAQGVLHPLPKPSVDTGMGLERLAAVMQGVHSNYEIDIFQRLIEATADLAGCADRHNPSLKVIADHIRSCSFLIADGVLPSNEGRGYVLRRIIRRAVRHGHKLGLQDAFFYRLVATLSAVMGEAYPELVKSQSLVERILRQEEERFSETLAKGLHILEQDIKDLQGKTLPGHTVFLLYDTYGFPVDLTADIARERGLSLDLHGFEQEMAAQRARARAASHFDMDYPGEIQLDVSSEFTGYEYEQDEGEVVALLNKAGQVVEALQAGEEGGVVLNHTPFYAESGGQVGDTGELRRVDTCFVVRDTKKQGQAHVHFGVVQHGTIRCGETLGAHIDAERRLAIVLNHSATHLLHAALREILGDHVQQKGSLVAPERLRFDFSHFEPLTPEQLERIERHVNYAIRTNAKTKAQLMPMQAALESGALALFGEKYGAEVRVLSMGPFSVELCGGVHVERTGDIGLFKIVAESGVASGVRRIEALSGERALDYVRSTEHELFSLAGVLRTSRSELGDKLSQLLERSKGLEKELETLKAKLASQAGQALLEQVVDVAGIKVLSAELSGADPKSLRETVDQLKNKLGEAAVVLATIQDGKVSLVAGVTPGLSKRLPAGELVNMVAQQVGGKGGGRPDMAMAGGTNPQALPGALNTVSGWIQERIL